METVFEEHTNVDAGIACSGEGDGRAVCFISCSCNEDNEWYSSCPGDSADECVSVTDTRYAGGLASMSANGSLSSMSANGGLSAMSAGNSLTTASAGNYTISTMSSGSATTCYQLADCDEEEGWYEKYEDEEIWKFETDSKYMEQKGRCYRATSCKPGYHNVDELKPDFLDYFDSGIGPDGYGMVCLAGSCKPVADEEDLKYFIISEYDIGDGTICKYASDCNASYGTSSPSASECFSPELLAEAKNGLKCYTKTDVGAAIRLTLVVDQYAANYTLIGDETTFKVRCSGYSGTVNFTFTTNSGEEYSGGTSCGGISNTLKTVNKIDSGMITSASYEGGSSAGHCGISEFTANGEKHQVRMIFDIDEMYHDKRS